MRPGRGTCVAAEVLERACERLVLSVGEVAGEALFDRVGCGGGPARWCCVLVGRTTRIERRSFSEWTREKSTFRGRERRNNSGYSSEAPAAASREAAGDGEEPSCIASQRSCGRAVDGGCAARRKVRSAPPRGPGPEAGSVSRRGIRSDAGFQTRRRPSWSLPRLAISDRPCAVGVRCGPGRAAAGRAARAAG